MDVGELVRELHLAGLTGPVLSVTLLLAVIVLKFNEFTKVLGEVLQKRKDAQLAHERAMRELEADIAHRTHQLHERVTFMPKDDVKQITHELVEPPPTPNIVAENAPKDADRQ